ncbi:hypothetical protein H4R23_004936 [Coemansia sp. Cherry 401B]|nr:hypothetical protein H4R23_004936 [Coemansia sp. Cherry 401B]
MAAAERDLATVYARVGDILRVPADEGALLLPAAADGMQGVGRRLKALQQQMVEAHCAISDALKHGALDRLEELHRDVVGLRTAYSAAVQPLHSQLKHSADVIAKRTQLLNAAITAAKNGRNREVAKDPFILNLEVAALLRKHAETESQLRATCVAQQAQMRDFEPQLVERLGAVVSDFMDETSARQKQLRLAAKRDVRAIACMDHASEWSNFSHEYAHVLQAPLGGVGLAAPDTEYAAKHSDWVRVLRQGVVALKEHGPLFRSTWQSKYGVLTTRGYFHVFRSQGDVVRGAPETSIFLPRARIASTGSGTLQISCGSRFSRSRIVIQDGTASLDNWRLLMEAAGHGAEPPAEAGLATPESSADELPQERADVRRSGARRRSELSTATPTRGRPFSADVSMLAQTPTPFARAGQRVSFTPTQDIYMQPLGGTPASPPNFAHVPYVSPIIKPGETAEFAAYSPGFSDSPATGAESSDDMLGTGADAARTAASSSSSGAPHQPESLFERNMSQDSESAPIASLPKLHNKRFPARSYQEAFPDADNLDPASAASLVAYRELGCDASIHSAGPMRRGGSIVDLQTPRLYSSSSGLVPGPHSYSQDIWHSDLLSVPDPAVRLGGARQRPRSLIYPGSDAAVLDPHNPYLGEFLAKRNVRDTRVGSHGSSSSTGQQTTLWRGSTASNIGVLHPRVVSQPAEMGAATTPPL